MVFGKGSAAPTGSAAPQCPTGRLQHQLRVVVGQQGPTTLQRLEVLLRILGLHQVNRSSLSLLTLCIVRTTECWAGRSRSSLGHVVLLVL